MNRWLILAAAMLMAGATGVILAFAAKSEGPALIAGDRPVTEDQVKDALQSQGWSNIEIRRAGDYLQVTGSKDGQVGDMTVDPRTGRLRDDDDDDD